MARPTALDRPEPRDHLRAGSDAPGAGVPGSDPGADGAGSDGTGSAGGDAVGVGQRDSPGAVGAAERDPAAAARGVDWVARPGGDRRWVLAVVVTVLVAASIPLAWQPRWYFFGDTQIGAFGQWYHLGRALRAGNWPVLDVRAWSSGNFAAEGQWGLFSPLTMVIALLSTVVPNAVVFTTGVKLVLLVGGALGVYRLIRSYHVGPGAGYLAAVAVTIGGASQYLESPSWVTGQMVWALLPWFWWQLRLVAGRRANPALALVFGFSMVAVGYVYGVLYLAIAVLGCMVDAFRARSKLGALRMLLVGVFCALFAVTVYLPGVLTAPVTVRGAAVLLSDGQLQGTVFTTLTSMLPLAPQPTTYVLWLLPALAWLGLAKLRAQLVPMTGLMIGLLLSLAWVIGPNQVGPIRWPLRVLPILTMFVVVCSAILLARARTDRLNVARLRASLLILTAAAFLTVSRYLDDAASVMAGTGLVALGLLLTWAALRRADASRPSAESGAPLPAHRSVVGVITVLTLAVVVLQHAFFPQPPSFNRNMPTLVSAYSDPLRAAEGDVFVLGDPEQALIADPAVAKDFLIASSWYLSPQRVQNEYTTIGYRTYVQRYCVHYNGTTCPQALKTLFSVEPGTKVPRVDLLSIGTLQLFRKDFSERQLSSPPAGWRVAARTRWAVTWVRDDAPRASGGVSWASTGTTVSTVSTSDRKIVLAVGDVPAAGGRVVLSRLDWPGYQVAGAVHASPTDGYLLTLDLPASAKGSRVTVTFAPPGWSLEKASLAAAVLAAVLWVMLHLALTWWRRRSTPGPTTTARS